MQKNNTIKEDAQKILKLAEANEKNVLYWEAEKKYREALLEFNKLSGHKKEKSLCKKKIREMNIKKIDSFVPIDISLSKEQKNGIAEIINTENTNELLDKIGRASFLCPSYQKIKRESKNNIPISLSITDFDIQDRDGNFVKSGHEPSEVWFNQLYYLAQIPITYLCLTEIFHGVIDNKLNIEKLFNYFESKNVFSEDFLKILNIALGRFFEGDYVSFLHILIPQFENAFLVLTDSLDGDISVITGKIQKENKEKIWTQDCILSDVFLTDPTVKNIWGEDFCEQVSFVFFSQVGFKLRHKIAHGNIKLEELNFPNSALVLYFFLVLCLKVKES